MPRGDRPVFCSNCYNAVRERQEAARQEAQRLEQERLERERLVDALKTIDRLRKRARADFTGAFW